MKEYSNVKECKQNNAIDKNKKHWYNTTIILRSMIVVLFFDSKHMSRVQICDINKKERQEIVGELFDIVTSLRTKKQTIGFLMGLLSPSEILMLARRVQIAQMLLEGMSYKEISKKIKVSETTVATVSRWLYDEDNQIFKRQIEKNYAKDKKLKTKKYYNNVLSPYGQLKALKDIINNKM